MTDTQNIPGEPESARSASAVHWAVRGNRRIRSVCFAAVFVASVAHVTDPAREPVGPVAVVVTLLALQFFVYPQALYWRARLRPDSFGAEIENLRLDCFVAGLWAALLGFPLWLSFGMFLAGVLGLTAFLGLRGFGQAAAGFLAAAVPASALGGWQVSLQAGWLPTLLAMGCVLTYLTFFALGAYHRSLKLHEARQRVRLGQQALSMQLEEIRALQARFEEQANRDPLTGVYNRRYLEPTIDRELARCRREGKPLSVMMLDVDHFKQINDTHGHQAGDEVLKQLASLLADRCRTADVVCRFGGEEFLLLLPDMPLEVALDRAERLRADFAETVTAFGGEPIRATVSIGVANLPEHGEQPSGLIHQADSALYRAKAEGRNRVIVSVNSA